MVTRQKRYKLRRGGDGHIVVWGGVSLWRSLMRLDLIDELQLSLFPYVAGEGTRLFDGVPSPTDSTWSPAPPPATGSSSSRTAGTANRGTQDHTLRGHSRTMAHTSVLSPGPLPHSTCINSRALQGTQRNSAALDLG
jgi:RibD C-terminal domain